MNEEYEEQQQMPYGYPSGHMGEGLVRFQLNSEEIISNIEHNLLCEVPFVDPDTDEVIWQRKKGVEPLMNKQGVDTVVLLLRSLVTKVITLTDWESEHIDMHTRVVWNALREVIYGGWTKFEIKTKANATTINAIIMPIIHGTFRRAYAGQTMRNIGKTTQSHEITQIRPQMMGQQQMMQEPKKSLLGGIFKR